MKISENSKNILPLNEYTIINETAQQSQLTRGHIAAHEQMRILRQATKNVAEPREPQSRGEVAAHEQIRILRQAMTTSKMQQPSQLTRGHIAAHEQMKILQQLL